MVVEVLSSLLAQFLLLHGGGGLPLAYPTEVWLMLRGMGCRRYEFLLLLSNMDSFLSPCWCPILLRIAGLFVSDLTYSASVSTVSEAEYETRLGDLEAEVSHPVVFVWGWSCLGVVSVLVVLFYCTLLW
ncbi:hypothetical protein A2U01_0000612 [Trifolium medium]|uniref:Uncharacterized protein n=1 Tax=Trifolium medium TaxID=97028 RepID=A0A392LY20_9FABA|nr:hypothetical protein [Trifolium medium]